MFAQPTLVALVLIALSVAVSSVEGSLRRPTVKREGFQPHDANKKFSQYNATNFLWNGSAPLAQWENLPFPGPIGQVLFVDAIDGFVFIPAAAGGVSYLLPLSALGNGGHGIPTPSSFRPLPTVQFSSEDCGPVYSISSAVNGSSFGSPIMVAACNGTTEGQLTLRYCGLEVICTETVVNRTHAMPPVEGLGFRPGQVALQFQRNGGIPVADKIMVGTTHGLYAVRFNDLSTIVNPTSIESVAIVLTNTTGTKVTNSNVSFVWCLPETATVSPTQFRGGECYIGTATQYCVGWICPANQLHRVKGTSEIYFYRTRGIIDRIPRVGLLDRQREVIHFGNDECVDLLYSNDSLWRIEGRTGDLPMNRIHCGSSTTYVNAVSQNLETHIWYGTEHGAVLKQPDGSWKYLNGPRWLPTQSASTVEGNMVTSIASAAWPAGDIRTTPSGFEEATVLVTALGISVVQKIWWSLEEKAHRFEQIQFERHNDDGLSTPVPLSIWGDARSARDNPQDFQGSCNSGLWSSIYLAAESFRYAATGDPAAKANAWRTFAGMKLLFNVTGVPGYPARGFTTKHETAGNYWHQSTTMPGYWWQGQTSSDEITGHMMAYPIFYDLVAETDNEKKDVAGVITALMSNIVDHGLRLYGAEDTPTHWGRWDPVTLNDTPYYFDDRGENGLEILAFLSAAYRITGNTTFMNVYFDLVDHYGYGENLIGAKITEASDVNFSDDELLYCAFMAYQWNGQSPFSNPCYERTKTDVLISLERQWLYVAKEKSNWWNIATAASFEQYNNLQPGQLQQMIDDAVWCLTTWTTNWVNWPTDNSFRLDIYRNPHVKDVQSMENILPYDENGLLLWNGNPFDLRRGGGTQEHAPSAWLLPYWMARYYGYIEAKP